MINTLIAMIKSVLVNLETEMQIKFLLPIRLPLHVKNMVADYNKFDTITTTTAYYLAVTVILTSNFLLLKVCLKVSQLSVQ